MDWIGWNSEQGTDSEMVNLRNLFPSTDPV